jgi:hypothetical protein
METDPHRMALSHIMDAAAWLHSIAAEPGVDSVLAGDAQAAAVELLDLVEAYSHLWPMPADHGPAIADPP